MKRNIALLLVCSLLATVLFGATALAEGPAAVQAVDPNYEKGVAIVDEANAQIAQVVQEAQNSDFPFTGLLIASVVVRTELIAKTAMLRAKLCGVKVICVYETVVIRGRKVRIDPLKVVTV